jgi:hypothetical protein
MPDKLGLKANSNWIRPSQYDAWAMFVQPLQTLTGVVVMRLSTQSAFELFDARLHHHHLRHELWNLLLQGQQRPDLLVLLRVAELAEIG